MDLSKHSHEYINKGREAMELIAKAGGETPTEEMSSACNIATLPFLASIAINLERIATALEED